MHLHHISYDFDIALHDALQPPLISTHGLANSCHFHDLHGFQGEVRLKGDKGMTRGDNIVAQVDLEVEFYGGRLLGCRFGGLVGQEVREI